MFKEYIIERTINRIGGSQQYRLRDFIWYTKHQWKQCHSPYLSYQWFKGDFKKMWYWYSSCFKTFFDDLSFIKGVSMPVFLNWYKSLITRGIFWKYR